MAAQYGRTKWHYGLLAIAIYIGSQFIFGIAYVFYIAATNPQDPELRNYNSFSGVNIVGWILSIIAVYGFYKLIENRFKKNSVEKPESEIQYIGKTDEQA